MSELEIGLWLLAVPVIYGILAIVARLIPEELILPLSVIAYFATSFGFIFYGLFS